MWSGRFGSVCTSSCPWEAGGMWPKWDNFATTVHISNFAKGNHRPDLNTLQTDNLRSFNLQLVQGLRMNTRQDLFIKYSFCLGLQSKIKPCSVPRSLQISKSVDRIICACWYGTSSKMFGDKLMILLRINCSLIILWDALWEHLTCIWWHMPVLKTINCSKLLPHRLIHWDCIHIPPSIYLPLLALHPLQKMDRGRPSPSRTIQTFSF